MKNITKLFILSTLALASCSKTAQDLTLKVNIKGLKEGVLYLKKIENKSLVAIDSVKIKEGKTSKLYSALNAPEVFYLYLNKDLKENRITFFADKGTTEINTTASNFIYDANIKGSKQQNILEKYNTIISEYKNKNLELTKAFLEAKIKKDSLKVKTIKSEQNRYLKRRYLYTINFAINHKDSEVAPYLALTEIYDAKLKYLDTIYKVLTPKVKMSKYGKNFLEFLNTRKNKN